MREQGVHTGALREADGSKKMSLTDRAVGLFWAVSKMKMVPKRSLLGQAGHHTHTCPSI